ncbi:MAG: peptidylprolyl isomerase, partial [Ferruginibacter sp.]
MKYFLFIILLALLISCANKTYQYPHVLIETDIGDIELEVYTAKAPLTASAFLLNVDKGLYKNAVFYRVLKTDDQPVNNNPGLIQGGVYHNDITAPLIPHEPTRVSGLSHTDGT